MTRTTKEHLADAARDRLRHTVEGLALTEGQRKRLSSLISMYGIRQFEAGLSRGERNRA